MRSYTIEPAQDGGFVVTEPGYRESFGCALRFAGSLGDCLSYIHGKLTDVHQPPTPLVEPDRITAEDIEKLRAASTRATVRDINEALENCGPGRIMYAADVTYATNEDVRHNDPARDRMMDAIRKCGQG